MSIGFMSGTWNKVRNCLLDSQEAERQHLAQTLHDGPLQEIHSLDFGLVALGRHLKDAPVREEWTAMRTTLQSISRQIRALCQDLRPPALGPFGLSVVLRSSAENFQRHNPEVTVALDLAEDGLNIPHSIRLTFYRICQLALRNITQHADAHHVRIALGMTPDKVTMTVEDDGRGFSRPASWLEWAGRGRLGLFECEQHAQAIDGTLAVQTAPGQGVRLQVSAPCPRQPSPPTERENLE
jgi:signal transduction histidine kinase